MKFTLVSDLHLDISGQLKVPHERFEDVVVIAGDTSNGLQCLNYYDKLRKKGITIVSVDGNHEHYSNVSQGRTIDETESAFYNNVSRMQNISDIPFVSSCGWYTVRDDTYWQYYMNDKYRCNTNYEEVNNKAKEHAAFLMRELERWKQEKLRGVVVTHMAPCTETLDPRFKGEYSNEWYWSHYLRYLIVDYAPQILVWCHGHTHSASEAIVDGVRVVCNPRGYPGENPNWVPITIEV